MINNHIISWVRKIKQISASPRNPKPGSTDNAGISVNSVSGIICNTLGLGVFCLHQKQLAGCLFWVERPFETVFQSISGRPPERWRKRKENIKESKNVYAPISLAELRPFETRMVVHGQLVEPAICLSDLYDVFLLDIVRDTRQNLRTMIYRSQ